MPFLISSNRRHSKIALLGLFCIVAGGAYWSSRTGKAVLRVGYNHFPPYVNADNAGKPVGFAVEMIARAAEMANVRVKWVHIPGSAEDAWERDDIDVYPLLTITPAREQTVHLSPAWWEDELALVSLQKDPVRSTGDTVGKRIATRVGYVEPLSASLFPGATLLAIPPPTTIVSTLCSGVADGFFVDARVFQAELLNSTEVGTEECRQRSLSVVSVPNGRISLGTASTKKSGKIADRVYQQIAQLALDGTLARIASHWGLFSPYQSGQMKAMVDARRRADLTTWGCVIASLVLVVFYLQILDVRRARRNAEEAHAEAEQSRVQLFHQANHDVLTGLANRRLFGQILNEEIAGSGPEGLATGLFYFDLDNFKSVNDSLGHQTGDELLIALAARLRAAFAGNRYTFARMGGDEFALIASQLLDESEAGCIAQRLLDTLQEEPFAVSGETVHVGASIGVSLFPRDGADAKTLSRSADSATYEAKRLGKNRVQFFNPEMEAAIVEKSALQQLLAGALDRGELLLHYQPQIRLATNDVVGFEALLRWERPGFEKAGFEKAGFRMIPPSMFIPIAEETGLIIPIGEWVLREACRQASCWQRDFGRSVKISVNVSVVQLRRPDFVEIVMSALQSSLLPPRLLELEITETILMDRFDRIAENLSSLRNLGVGVSLDDFGTGYSSLSYLHKLPVDTLKIDRSFLADIQPDRGTLALIAGLTSLAHSLGKTVVVEGVETASQLNAIQLTGCDPAQGFLIGRPVPASSVRASIATVQGPQADRYEARSATARA
jgi:diguanylate cyclase (GGDEF)-like protein